MIKAVALIFRFNDKVFAIKRQNSLRVFPGYHSFPGGKIDESDQERESAFSNVKDEERALINGLEREVFEEVGVSLEELFLSGAIERPELFGQAVSPNFNPYKFETYYYLVTLRSLPQFKLEVAEIDYGKWDTPDDILKQYERGEVLCVPPFLKILNALRDGGWGECTEDGIFDFSLKVDERVEIPMIEPLFGIKHYFVPSLNLLPALFTNCFLIDGILVDPSPNSMETLERLLYSLRQEKVRKIFITHHHRDHLHLADKLAEKLGVAIMMSERTHFWLERSSNSFSYSKIEIIKDGECLGRWIDRAIIAKHIPGHADGQFALHSQDMQWFIAGDLFQHGATVVVGGEEGDMGEYQHTLAEIITLSPKVLFPSHGIAVYGTGRIEKTLHHTQIRSEQVRALHESGATIDEMLSKIYKGTPKELLRYARKNIISHLKLLDER